MCAAAPSSNVTVSNLGIGTGVFAQQNGSLLSFNSLQVTGSLVLTVISGTIFVSGSAGGITQAYVDNSIATLSGFATGAFSTSVQLAATGQALYSDLINLSGQFNSTATSSGHILYGQLTGASGAAALSLSQTGASLYADLIGLSGQSVSTATALAATGSLLYNDLTSLSGASAATYATISALTATGSALYADLISLSGASSAAIASSGSTLYSLILGLSGTELTPTNLTQTGVQLGASINALSGYGNTVFATLPNLAATGAALLADLIGLSGSSASAYATLFNLTSTGVQLELSLNALSGSAASVATLAATGTSLYLDVIGLSGQAASTYATISNLQSTGQALYTDISGLSGQAAGIYATISNLAVTGTMLYNDLLGLSGLSLLSGASVGGGISVISGVANNTLQHFSFTGSTGIQLSQSGNMVQVAVRFNSGEPVQFFNATLASTGLASHPSLTLTETGGLTTILGPALWNKQFVAVLPNITTTQTLFGDTVVNVGTLSTTTSEVLGDITDFVVTAAAGFLAAGTSTTTSRFYRGSMTGRNGFFFTCQFGLNTPWASGLNTSVYGNPSGSRFFCGLSDQTFTNATLTNDPGGNRIGLSYVFCSGGTQPARYDQDWVISSKNNVTQFTGDTAMLFQTGLYRFSMYCQPFPNNTSVSWQLDDLLRGTGVAGQMTGSLPIGSTALHPGVYINSCSGVKSVKCSSLYCEMPM